MNPSLFKPLSEGKFMQGSGFERLITSTIMIDRRWVTPVEMFLIFTCHYYEYLYIILYFEISVIQGKKE